MDSEAWVLCTGRLKKDTIKFHSLYSTKEKAVESGIGWLSGKGIGFLSGCENRDDRGDEMMVWTEYTWRYNSKLAYFFTVTRCKVQ